MAGRADQQQEKKGNGHQDDACPAGGVIHAHDGHDSPHADRADDLPHALQGIQQAHGLIHTDGPGDVQFQQEFALGRDVETGGQSQQDGARHRSRQGRKETETGHGQGREDAGPEKERTFVQAVADQTGEKGTAVDDDEAVEHVDASDVGLGHIGLLEEDRQKVVEETHAEQGRGQQSQQDESQEVAVRQQAADLRQRQSGGRGFFPDVFLLFLSAQQTQGHQGQTGQDDGSASKAPRALPHRDPA